MNAKTPYELSDVVFQNVIDFIESNITFEITLGHEYLYNGLTFVAIDTCFSHRGYKERLIQQPYVTEVLNDYSYFCGIKQFREKRAEFPSWRAQDKIDELSATLYTNGIRIFYKTKSEGGMLSNPYTDYRERYKPKANKLKDLLWTLRIEKVNTFQNLKMKYEEDRKGILKSLLAVENFDYKAVDYFLALAVDNKRFYFFSETLDFFSRFFDTKWKKHSYKKQHYSTSFYMEKLLEHFQLKDKNLSMVLFNHSLVQFEKTSNKSKRY